MRSFESVCPLLGHIDAPEIFLIERGGAMYLYRVFPLAFVVGYFASKQRVEASGEGYVSSDAMALELEAALSAGYRWVRIESAGQSNCWSCGTAEEIAIFEKGKG